MKIKVRFFEKKILLEYLNWVAFISTLSSFILIFFNIENKKKILGFSFLGILLLVYFFLWIRANLLTKIKLKINNSIIEVKVGDIFKEKGYKVIAFNEYFDTKTDDIIISKKSLNGQYIDKKLYKIDTDLDTIEKFDDLIKNLEIESIKKLKVNSKRKSGKKQKYKLGSALKIGDYILTAMTKFDKENRANLLQAEYINFLFEFWNNLDILYNGNTVVIPILGSGITRFKEKIDISDQELLNIIILSFKICKIKFCYPSKLKIIIYEGKKDKINLYYLKQLESR